MAVLAAALATASPAQSYLGIEMGEGADCSQCHVLSFDEATEMVKSVNSEIEVMEIKQSPVAGLWEITILARGKRGIAYIDFPKTHIITGSIIDVSSSLNLTNKRLYEISKVEFSDIPLEDALILGNPEARFKAIVFNDPDCPYCKNLHREMRSLVEEYEDIAFYIKLLPLKVHPTAYKKAKAIVCLRSMALLERSYDGRPLPEPTCETTEVDDTIELAEQLGIATTPTIILPDGGVVQGFKDRETLLDLVETAGRALEEMITTRQAEIESKRLRKLREMEREDFEKLIEADNIIAFHEFLDKYPSGKKRNEALEQLSMLIEDKSDSLILYRDFIARYPDGLFAIPEEHRLLYVGPRELPLYAVLQLLDEGMDEAQVAAKVSSMIGRYKEFTVGEVQRLAEMGVSDTIVDAMLEATFKAKRREDEARRQLQESRLMEDADQVQAAIYDMQARLDMVLSDDPEALMETITDEVGTPLTEKIERCEKLLDSLASCRQAGNIDSCRTTAQSEFLCE